jgi:thioredoxin-related protein
MNVISPCLAVVALIALTAPFSSPASEVAKEGAEVGKWTMDYEAATKLAKDKKLPLLLNFTGSDWCGWCKLMDGNVYAKSEWNEFAAKNLVLVTIDFPQDKSIVPPRFVAKNEELKGKFGIRGFPSYVILDSDADTKLGQLGAGQDKTPESFIKEVEGVLRFRQANIDSKVAALGATKGAEYKAAMDGVKKAESALRDWIGTGPQKNAENDQKFEVFKKGILDAHAKLDSF